MNFKKFFYHNIRVFFIWFLLLFIGYCLGGKIGMGIGGLLILLSNVIP